MTHAFRPVRTFEVTVAGFGSALYSARTPGKAMGCAFRSFRNVNDRMRYAGFMQIAKVRRVKDPAGCGERIVVETTAGVLKTVTRCYGPTAQYVYFMSDDSDDVLSCHPLDVRDQGRKAA